MTEKKTIAVLGMMCAACAANVERRLAAQEGVVEACVNLPSRTVRVEYDPQRISLEQMKGAVAAIGYDMVIEEDRNVEAIERRAHRRLLWRTVAAWGLAAGVMFVTMMQDWLGLSAGHANQVALILALVALGYCGRPFYASALRQLRHASANMDTLVALSTAITFAFSVFNTFWGDAYWLPRGLENHTYFDASTMIIAFVLTGRLLEERARRGTAAAVRALMGLQPKVAHQVDGDGGVNDIPIAAVQRGDGLEVRAGEKIPVDGVVVASAAGVTVDESMMTGESIPADKSEGMRVLAGTIVLKGPLRMRAEAVGRDTVLAAMIRTVQEAQGSKAPVQRVVDRVALIFVPAVVVLSLVTFGLWLLIGGSEMLPRAILSAVSVLVIACPCAMGLATPTALMVGMGRAAEKQILIKDAAALEQLRRVDALVIDKTGTLTMTDGQGREALAPHAAQAMDTLQGQGVEVCLMSGDTDERVARVAREAHIARYHSRALPQDKEALVRRLQAEGRHVAMVGDGINDSQALAVADVSIAMGRGTDVAMDVAQVTLMTTDLRRLPEAIALSRRTVAMIRQNLFWAFVYNLVCIPLAAGVPYLFGHQWQITPIWASALMAFSSVSVVLNSLRLRFRKVKSEE
ncbi:MAG: heavy metal translocating P-type ATPase [Prevotella sp.]|nr:heavy metal translocating P-type ATPase [Prevotella sp.]